MAATKIVVASLLLLATSGCSHGHQVRGIATGGYVATIGGDLWQLHFLEHGRFSVSINGSPTVEGSYRIEDGEIQFTDERGRMVCEGETRTGRYRCRLDEDRLTFELKEDNCTGRAMASRVWHLDRLEQKSSMRGL